MALTSQEIILRIVAAFEQRTLPEGAPLFESYSSEVDTDEFERLARHTTWIEFPKDVLCDNPLAPAFLTPEAFAWLLPAYLVVSVTLYSETDTLTGTLLTCLTPPDDADAVAFKALTDDMAALGVALDEDLPDNYLGADDGLREHFGVRAAVLTQDEKVAIRDYLEHIEAVHGADFPVFGPKQALDRYWRAAATGG
jgi:hypothetical protein